MSALGRLLRLSLAPSAAADVAAGAVLGCGAWPAGAAPWFAIAGSLAVYHGGMVLNDWADRAEDAELRPDRPIPSGRVPAPQALALGLALVALAPLAGLAAGARPGILLCALALLVVAYNLGPRGPWLGPFLLGLCRAGNFALGLSLAGPALSPSLVAPAVAYGLYVVVVSRLARLEDMPPETDLGRVPAQLCALAGLVLVLVPLAALAAKPPLWALALALLVTTAGAAALLDRSRRVEPWLPPEIPPLVGLGLRRLLVATAALALCAPPDGVWVAGAILAGYPVSFALRRVFPPS